MKKRIQKYIQLAKQHLLLPRPKLRLPEPRLELPAPIKKILGWPIIPWLVLVGIILALLFLPLGCARKPQVTAPEFSNVVPGYYGEFKLLANSQPIGSELLATTKMSDGKVLIIYRHPASVSSPLAADHRARPYSVKSGIVPVVFDPATDSFSQLRDAIAFDSSAYQRQGFSWLLLNDHTFVVVGGSVYVASSNDIRPSGGGTIFDLISGEKTSFGPGSFSGWPFIAKLSDNEFVVADIKVKAREGQAWVSDPYEAWLRVYDAAGTELRSAQVNPYQLMPSSGGHRDAAKFVYDAGDKLVVTLSGRIDIIDKHDLSVIPVSNALKLEVHNGAQIDALDSGLLFIHNYPQRTQGSLGSTVYLVNPANLQAVPLKLAHGLPINKLAWDTITTFTEEIIDDTLRITNKTPYRFSVLRDGTILAVPNNLGQINKYPHLIDLNNYRLIENANPPEEIVELRNPLIPNSSAATFAADVTLDDGRVIYLGVQNVIYTPSSEQTPEQAAISAGRGELPDWPSTDFTAQGVWQPVGNLKVTAMFPDDVPANWSKAPYSNRDIDQFVRQVLALGDNVLIKWVDPLASDIYAQLFSPLAGKITLVKNTEENKRKYEPVFEQQADARYTVSNQYGTFRVMPNSRVVEKYDAQNKKWINLFDENLRRLTEKYEKQGKTLIVADAFDEQLKYNNLPGVVDKVAYEDQREKLADARAEQVKAGKMVILERNQIGGGLIGATLNSPGVVALSDGRILITGVLVTLEPPCLKPLDNEGLYTQHCVPKGSFKLPYQPVDAPPLFTSPKGLNLVAAIGVEIYDPKMNENELVGQLKLARGGHSVVLLPDNLVLVAGGNTDVVVKNEAVSERVGIDSYNRVDIGPTYEIFNLETGESQLYENVLIFRRDREFHAFAMPNGHIYLGDTGLYSNAEVLDWYNHISYPTGQPSLQGLGYTGSTVLVPGDKLISTGGEGSEFRDETNRVIDVVLDPTVIEAYAPTSKGPRILPRVVPAQRVSVPFTEALRYFLYLQLTVLLLGMPLIYLMAYIARRRRLLKR